MKIRFDGRVAIVTGAGNGLGRSHALALAARGAKVVVNDLGGSRDGGGGSLSAAERVVAEILARGGEAMANGASVSDPRQVEAMVEAVVTRWGRVDILVNNAGILRDKSFSKMDLADFRAVIEVHLMGAVHCSKAVWEIMRGQNYGRIAMTTSSTGLYGNFGQSNYGAAKLALVGLMNTLHLEGAKYGIRVNALAPCAATRMTEDLMTPEALGLLSPEAVSAGLLYLVSENAPSREILSAGAGVFARARICESDGFYLEPERCTPEQVAENWDRIADPSGERELPAGWEQGHKFLAKAASGSGIKLLPDA